MIYASLRRPTGRLGPALVALGWLLAACGPAAAPAPTTAPAPTAPAAAKSAPATAASSPVARTAASPSPAPTTAAATGAAKAPPVNATLVLDWFPNTNHVGVYLAQAKGWYAEQGINLKIEAPSDATASMKLVGAGNAEFGISYQPAVTIARAQDVPAVSVAALVQHNIGAYAAKKSSGITRPKQFEGKRVGSVSLPQARVQLNTVMRCDGGDPAKVDEVTIGQNLSQALLADRVDFMGLLPTWEGVEMELKGAELTYLPYRDYCLPDAYHLVFITSDKVIQEKADLVKRFVAATQRGYEYSIQNPAEAEAALMAAAPDLDRQLVHGSMERLVPFFADKGQRWGVQEVDRWVKYAAWMWDNKLIEKQVDGTKAVNATFVAQ